jgi:hypothetical protein
MLDAGFACRLRRNPSMNSKAFDPVFRVNWQDTINWKNPQVIENDTDIDNVNALDASPANPFCSPDR